MTRVAVLVTLPSLLRAKKSQHRLAAGTNNWEAIIRPIAMGLWVPSKHGGARSNSREKKMFRLNQDSLEILTCVGEQHAITVTKKFPYIEISLSQYQGERKEIE